MILPWYLGRQPLVLSRRRKETEIITNRSRASNRFITFELLQDDFDTAFFTSHVDKQRTLYFCCQGKTKAPQQTPVRQMCQPSSFHFFLNQNNTKKKKNRHFAVLRDLEPIKNNAGCLVLQSEKKKIKTPRVCLCLLCGRNRKTK